jgi:glycosyltransferase involved in cell wall biosynthesis
MANEAIKVSVVIPIYNTNGKYLRECIESVLGQTYPNNLYEIIVVNDGSTNEDTLLILEEYKNQVKLINQENKKTAGALNTGIRNMSPSSEWFMWLSSDDVWYLDKIEQQMHFIEENPDSKVVYSDWDRINNFGFVLKKEIEPEFETLKDQQHHLCFKFFGCGSTIAIHKSVFQEVGVFNEEIFPMEDYEFWIRMSEKILFKKVKIPLLRYRDHEGSLTASADSNYIMKMKSLIMMAREKFNFKNVTAIVIGYNVESTIYDCLVSVSNQKYVNEIIIFDDASIDNTESEISKFLNEMKEINPEFKINYIRTNKNVGRGMAKSKSIEYASNNLIMFVDGDIILNPDSVRYLLNEMFHYGVRAICGSVRTLTPNDVQWKEHKDLILTEMGKISQGTAATLIDKKLLEEIPINASLRSGEDSDLFIRFQKYKIPFIKLHTIVGLHYDTKDLFEFIKRNYEYGMNFAYLNAQHSDIAKTNEQLKNISNEEIHRLVEGLRNYAFQLGFKENYIKIVNGLEINLEYKKGGV